MSNRVNIKDEYRERHYRVPKVFMTSNKYKKLSMNAKMTWAIFRDRTDLSLKNNWTDENGDVYFIFTYDDLMEILGISSKSTIRKIKKELSEAELIEEERQGCNKPNKLYLINPEVTQEDIYEIVKQENVEIPAGKQMTEDTENNAESLDTTGSTKNGLPKNVPSEVQNVYSNDTEFSETEGKEHKENKESSSYQKLQDRLHESLKRSEGEHSNEIDLINQFIEKEGIELEFQGQLLDNLRKYSHYDYQTFKLYYEKLHYSRVSIEKEKNIQIGLFEEILGDYAEVYRNELSKTFWKAVMQYRDGKVRTDFNNYLFGSFKKTWESIADSIIARKNSDDNNPLFKNPYKR